jgi:RNA polymerase sigma factor (sigma-70 family)
MADTVSASQALGAKTGSITRKVRAVPGKKQKAQVLKTPQAQKEATDAEGELYEVTIQSLRRCAKRLLRSFSYLGMEAEDLVSESWEKIVNALIAVPITDRKHFYNLACMHMRWLLNRLTAKYRREKLDNQLIGTAKQSFLQKIPAKGQSSRSRPSFLSPEYALYLGKALDQLSSEDREILTFSEWLNIPKEQIAKDLGIHRNTVTNRLKKIRASLRKDIECLARQASVAHE